MSNRKKNSPGTAQEEFLNLLLSRGNHEPGL